MQNQSAPTPIELHANVKLGIDAHPKCFYVARQLDRATPPPVHKTEVAAPNGADG